MVTNKLFEVDEEVRGFQLPTDSTLSVNYNSNGKAVFTLEVDRNLVRDLVDRWTWNPALVSIRSGDKDIFVNFPKLSERPTK